MSGLVQVGATSAVAGGSAPNPTITGVTAGNELICIFICNGNSSGNVPTDSAGQTWTQDVSQIGSSTQEGWGIYRLFSANAGTHTLTFNAPVSSSAAAISEWNGITAFDVAATVVFGTSVSTITTNSITQAQANEILFAATCTPGAINGEYNANSRPPTGWTGELLLQNDGSGSLAVFEASYFISTAIAAKTATWNWVSANSAIAGLAGYKYTPAAAGNPFEIEPQSTLSSHPVKDLGTVLVPNNLAIFTDKPIPLMGQCWT